MTHIIPVTGSVSQLEGKIMTAVAAEVAADKRVILQPNGGLTNVVTPSRFSGLLTRSLALALALAVPAQTAPLYADTPVTSIDEQTQDHVKETSEPEPEPSVIITTQLASPATEMYNAMHGTRDSFLQITVPAWDLDLFFENNRAKSFEGGTDYALIRKAFKSGGWTFTPGLRLCAHDSATIAPGENEGFVEGSLAVKRGWNDSIFKLVAVHDDEGFNVLRAAGNHKALYLSLGGKGVEAFTGESPQTDWHVGLADERAGLFLGQSGASHWALNAYANLPDFSLFYAGKEFHGLDKRWQVLLAGMRARGAAPGGLYMPGTNEFISLAIRDAVIHPLLAPFDSYLRGTGGEQSMELVEVKQEGLHIRQLGLGGRIFETKGGIQLYGGLSVQERQERRADGSIDQQFGLGPDVSLVVPVRFRSGPKLTLALDYRRLPGITAPGPDGGERPEQQFYLSTTTRF